MEKQKGTRHPKEIKDKAVRMFGGHRSGYSSEQAYITSIADKLDMALGTLGKRARTAQEAG